MAHDEKLLISPEQCEALDYLLSFYRDMAKLIDMDLNKNEFHKYILQLQTLNNEQKERLKELGADFGEDDPHGAYNPDSFDNKY